MSLSLRIQNDLRQRLRATPSCEVPLTLDALSAHYSVSVTPVRAAITALVADGTLIKQPNGRLIAGAESRLPDGAESVSSSMDTETAGHTSAELFARLERDLVRVSLGARPRRIREEAIARSYGVSRSAMRNLLNRLAGRGIVVHVPRKGWRVRPFRQADMEAFLEVRASLETKALELAWNRLDRDKLTTILAGNVPAMTSRGQARIDNSLHAYFIEESRNKYVKDFFDRHGPYFELLFEWEDQDRQAANEAAAQHRAILEGILANDRQRAVEALEHHIRGNHPVLRDLGHDQETSRASAEETDV